MQNSKDRREMILEIVKELLDIINGKEITYTYNDIISLNKDRGAVLISSLTIAFRQQI